MKSISIHIRNINLLKDLVKLMKSKKENDATDEICIKYNLSNLYVEKIIRDNKTYLNKLRAKSCPVKIKR